MRFVMIISWILACTMGLITAGCSSLPSVGNKDNKMVEIASKTESTKTDEVPAWFIEKETNNSNDLTVTGTGASKDMQFAIDKATLNAMVELSKKLGVKVDSITRESALESGYGVKDVEREIDRVSKLRTDQKLGFFRRENLKIVREGTHYRAYVMLKLSLEEARRLTTNNDTNKVSRDQRLKELEQAIKE